MAEDLTVSENSDFDFNDVVFDVKKVDDTHAKIKVLAAGGIYPIYIADDEHEAHTLLHAGMTMTNTYPGSHFANKAEPFTIEIDMTGDYLAKFNNIQVWVDKGNGKVELVAPTGKVPSKIGVPVSVEWCDEFQDIDEKWGGSKTSGKFAAWVSNPANKFWE